MRLTSCLLACLALVLSAVVTFGARVSTDISGSQLARSNNDMEQEAEVEHEEEDEEEEEEEEEDDEEQPAEEEWNDEGFADEQWDDQGAVAGDGEWDETGGQVEGEMQGGEFDGEQVDPVDGGEVEPEAPAKKGGKRKGKRGGRKAGGNKGGAKKENPDAVCCKCGNLASNGETVYSCSPKGACKKCKKYGGVDAAEKMPARGACKRGSKGKHAACKKTFEMAG